MAIFHKSILKEYGVTCFLTLLALFLIVFVTQLARHLGYAVTGNHPFSSMLVMFILASIKNLPVLFSLSVALTVTIVVGRSYRDSEMVIWNNSGKSIVSWVQPTIMFATPIALLVALLTLYVAPWAERLVEEKKRDLESRDDISSAPSGVFIESNLGDSVFFIVRD